MALYVGYTANSGKRRLRRDTPLGLSRGMYAVAVIEQEPTCRSSAPAAINMPRTSALV